jgi:hypothetical protein
MEFVPVAWSCIALILDEATSDLAPGTELVATRALSDPRHPSPLTMGR